MQVTAKVSSVRITPRKMGLLADEVRGKGINEEGLREFIIGLALPDEAKQRLLVMTPRSYVGLAVELARTA